VPPESPSSPAPAKTPPPRRPAHRRAAPAFPPLPPDVDAAAKQPVYWGYALAAGLLVYGQMLLENKRVAVVFDLDETLLQALTEKALKERIAATDEKMCGGRRREGRGRERGVRGAAVGCSQSGPSSA
jgi:hypothetical protein